MTSLASLGLACPVLAAPMPAEVRAQTPTFAAGTGYRNATTGPAGTILTHLASAI